MAPPSTVPRHVHVEHVLGTAVTIDLRTPAPHAEAVEATVRWLHEVDATFSTYRPDSAICRIDRGELRADRAPDDVQWVLARCETLRRETGGFFDARAGGALDPSALVKGWAVQCAADLLCVAGVTDLCLTAGGDVVTAGHAAPGRPWRIGIQHPEDPRAVAAIVEARDLAVATSGTYERGEHITDPHTGRPPRGVASVTVTGPDLGTADALATAAFAMGEAGPAWTLGLRGYAAMTILTDGRVLTTPRFPAVEG